MVNPMFLNGPGMGPGFPPGQQRGGFGMEKAGSDCLPIPTVLFHATASSPRVALSQVSPCEAAMHLKSLLFVAIHKSEYRCWLLTR